MNIIRELLNIEIDIWNDISFVLELSLLLHIRIIKVFVNRIRNIFLSIMH
jgi:hypothetical protein